MRVGTLCYATDQGLGNLAKSFYDNGVVTDVLVVKHHHRVTHTDWYPNAKMIDIRPFELSTAVDFVKTVDVVLFFETPFNWKLIEYCRAAGVKTVLMPMYECMPRELPAVPDLILCPSILDYDCYRQFNSLFIPVPVQVEWRERTRAKVFVHNAGHGGLKGRNGTAELIEAMQYVKEPLTLIVRTQSPINAKLDAIRDPRIDYRHGTIPHAELWKDGDAFIFPEKFNGLSLPLQEAHAAGMLVMAGNRFPMNRWLPTEPLIPIDQYRTSCISGATREFEEAVYDPRIIAVAMDTWYDEDITSFSQAGKVFAEEHSWANLKPLYMQALESL